MGHHVDEHPVPSVAAEAQVTAGVGGGVSWQQQDHPLGGGRVAEGTAGGRVFHYGVHGLLLMLQSFRVG
jgi:hypothetical protein